MASANHFIDLKQPALQRLAGNSGKMQSRNSIIIRLMAQSNPIRPSGAVKALSAARF
jgi:hypothetical protein